MQLQPFTQADHEAVAAYTGRMKRGFYIITAAQAAFFIIFAVIAPNNIPYWQYVLPAIFIIDIFTLYILSKKYRTALRDMREQLKITGRFKVLAKKETDESYFISVDAGGKKTIGVTKNVYSKVQESEELYCEFAKSSGLMLMMKRGSEVLQ